MFKIKVILEEFKNYALQDSISLLKALIKAKKIYLQDYCIDITSILSTNTLTLKRFRNKFLKNIPILKGSIDKFIILILVEELIITKLMIKIYIYSLIH